jgi:signal transduction histidine kinase
MTVPLQLVAERILLAALREQDAAAAALAARERAQFLADASLRFGASLDLELTYTAIAGATLPGLDGWCVVEVLEAGGGTRRLLVTHSAFDAELVERLLSATWTHGIDDPLGILAVRRARSPVSLGNVAALTTATRAERTRRILAELGIGSLLVVPIAARGELFGALSFVGRATSPGFTAEDIELAEALAIRCAQALEGAQLYADARAACAEAEAARADAEEAKIAAEVAQGVAELANETKAHFLSTMSHELRTPLNAIGGYAQLIELGIRGPVTPEQLSDLAGIQRSQAHLLGLVDSVLNYAQLEGGRVVYTSADVSLLELIESVADFVRPQMGAKSLRYICHACARAIQVRADAGKVRQIVLNLLANAIKFTAAGGDISLECLDGHELAESEGDRTPMHAVRVTDSGIGIAESKLAAIFDPFVQVLGRGLVGEDTGVGLGLAISRELARGMGGDLTVQSTLGTGSTFLLTLPAV